MDVADVLKLKVPELKSELQKLGLSPKGLKKDLQERLTDAIGSSKPQLDISGLDETPTKGNKDDDTKGSVAADESKNQEEPAEAATGGAADAVEPQNGSHETSGDKVSKSAKRKADEADSASHVASTEDEAPVEQPRDSYDQDTGTPEERVGDGMEEDAEREARDETPMEYDANQETEAMEVGDGEENKEGGDEREGGEGAEAEESKEKERSRSRSRSYPPSFLRRSRSRSKSKGHSRSRSRSKSRSPRQARSPPVYDEHLVKAGEEAERVIDETFEETERDDSVIVLDSYNSDLHFKVNGTSCTTISKHSLCYLWSGARATHGVTKGKHFFECKLVSKEEVEMPDVEAEGHYGVRVGFSVDSRNWVLGESDTSFGYASCGSKVTNGKLETYGETFDVDDVIGCFLDLESEEQTISFSKNGQDHGVAFKLSENIQGKPLFPHVFTRNVALLVNFGAEEASFPAPDGYSLLQEAPEDALVRGPTPPANITDTEVVMMVGLPGSGKTSWAHKYCRDNISKKYNILGADDIVQNIRIPVLPSKKSYPHKLTKISHDILARLYEIAEVRKRNYILDQCNYSEGTQSRKMGSFAQSQREAVVIIPKRDELQYRLRKRNRERSRDVSRTAIAQMKVDFHLPEEGELFQSVRFVEISGDDAKQMIEDYHSEGRRRLRSPSHERKRHRHRSPRHSTYRPRPRNYGGPPRDPYYRRQPPMDRRPGYFDRPPPPRMYDRPPRDPPRGPPMGDRYSRARPYEQPRSYPPRLDYGGYQPQSRGVYQGRGGGGGPGYGGQSRYGSGEPYYGGGGGGSVGYGGPPPPRGGAYSANRGGLGHSYGRGAGGSQMGGRGRGFDRGYGGYDDRSHGGRGGFAGGRGGRGRGMDGGRGGYGTGGGRGGYGTGGGRGGYSSGGRGNYMGHGGYR